MHKKVIFALVYVCSFYACSSGPLFATLDSLRVTAPITVEYVPLQAEVNALPSPFAPLSEVEKNRNSTRELFCGIGFLKSGDLFQAVTALKRAQLFAQDDHSDRLQQIEYSLILAHYLAQRYPEVIDTFSKSSLSRNVGELRSKNELHLMVYDSYAHTNRWQEASQCAAALQEERPLLFTNLKKHEHYMRCQLEELPADVYKAYVQKAKSPGKAALFNGLLPGAGYAYAGENSTAFTSFLINAIFIAATYEFCQAGQTGAAIICGSMECGWYFGGMYGAYLAAEKHNANVYQQLARQAMLSERLFPLMQFHYGF